MEFVLIACFVAFFLLYFCFIWHSNGQSAWCKQEANSLMECQRRANHYQRLQPFGIHLRPRTILSKIGPEYVKHNEISEKWMKIHWFIYLDLLNSFHWVLYKSIYFYWNLYWMHYLLLYFCFNFALFCILMDSLHDVLSRHALRPNASDTRIITNACNRSAYTCAHEQFCPK